MAKCALLLAAGLGTRLRPLTDVLPKCLAPIRGRPLLEYWLHMLADSGFDRIVVNTHYHADLVEAYLSKGPWVRHVTVSREPVLLGTGGTLVANASILRDGPILVAHADNLSVFDMSAFLAAHAARPPAASMTMMTFSTGMPSSCGIVTTDKAGLVNGFFEKVPNPPGNRANAAVYVLEQDVVDHVLSLHRTTLDLSTEVLPAFVGRMWTWHNFGYHRDIGSLKSWRDAQRDYPLSAPSAPQPDPWLELLRTRAPGAESAIAGLLDA